MRRVLRVLFASERPPYPFFLGGAARSAHKLLLSLGEHGGAQCLAVGSSAYSGSPWDYPTPDTYLTLGVRTLLRQPVGAAHANSEGRPGFDCGYPIYVLDNFSSSFTRLVDEFAPDIVWSQLEGARSLLTVAARSGVIGLLYVHDAEFDAAELRATAMLGCHIVCSSGFLAQKVHKVVKRTVHVIYPSSDWCFGIHGNPAGYITMINPHAVKGIDTFLEIARRLPDRNFLLVESWKLREPALAVLRTQLASLPNIVFMHRVADVREIFGRTRVLLIPSVWEEGFGMVAVEAQSCGIPVIASERGGLPESVGNGGILIRDYRNVDAWLEAIRSVLGDDEAYADWSARALEHARSPDFDPDELARRFLEICRSPVPHVSPLSHGLHLMLDRLEGLPWIGRLLREARR